jgi:hypothetical protein
MTAKIEKTINNLYESINIKCKELKEKYEKDRLDIIMKEADLREKHTKSKTYKDYKFKYDNIIENFRNTEIYKLYMNEYKKLNDFSKIDRKITYQFEKEEKKKNQELIDINNIYYKTNEYLKLKKNINQLYKDFLKTEDVKKLKKCSFENSKEEYKNIVKLIKPYFKKKNKKIYDFLVKLKINSITFRQYEKITILCNKIIQFNLFSYI